MNEAIELKYSRSDGIRNVLAYLISPVGQLCFYSWFFHVTYPWQVVLLLLLLSVAFSLRFHFALLHVDDQGIIYRPLFLKHRVAWADVAAYSASWRNGYASLFKFHETPGESNWQGKITLFGPDERRLLSIGVDFGSRADRNRMRLALMEHLQRLPQSKPHPAGRGWHQLPNDNDAR